MSITTYCIKINLIYELNILYSSFSLHPLLLWTKITKGEGFAVSALDLMSSCFYSKRDVVHHRSRLSLWIPWRHTQPILASDRPWRVQSSTASEHVASWWRGGGCGIRKRATSKNIALHVVLFPHAVTCESCCWNIKTGCQGATNKKSKSFLKCICLFLKQEEGGWLLARGHAAEALDVI